MSQFFKNSSEKKVKGIVIIPQEKGQPVQGKKYNYIDNTNAGISTFLQFAKNKFPKATHVNFYGRAGRYIDRIFLD